MAKKVVIIGGGIAGLSAGCYARMNGHEAEIYEMHDKPGGLCTAWKRKGYTIDGCLHWLTGSTPADSCYQYWAELGAVQGRRMIDHEVFYRYTGSDGKSLSLYCDADKLEAHMKELAPQDNETIELFCRLIHKFSKFLQMPVGKAFELYNILDVIIMMIRMMPYGKDFKFLNSVTLGDFGKRFKDPFLREIFPIVLGDGDYTLFGLVFTLALFHIKSGGIPEGGSLEFTKAIEKRFVDLGGKVFYSCKVGKILEKDGKAVGIRLADGQEIAGDYVISAADLRTTLYEMLDGKHVDPMHEELFRSVKLIPSAVQVSFGINMDLSSDIECLGELFKPKNPLTVGNKKVDWLMVKNSCHDPTLAPKGKSVVQCLITINDFSYWEKLYSDSNAYRLEKERIAKAVAIELEHKYPGFQSAIEVTDVVTPMTYVRYTGNWKGTFMTWIITPDKAKKFQMIKKTVPDLDNFWLSGMWVQPPGGVPTGAMTSRAIIQLMCKKDKKKFVTSTP
ncbi:phytoene desaturase family protein [Chloroflexota bacterium]